MLESEFQSALVKDIKRIVPDAIVTKNDPNRVQGIPDIIICFGKKYAMLECKRSKDSHHQPNQDYYIDKLKSWNVFAAFIYPENRACVLEALRRYFL